MSYSEGTKLRRTRGVTPRQDINAVKAELAILEAEQTTRNLVKAPPNGKDKYLGNGKHEWEDVVGDTIRLRVPGGWIYDTYNNESNTSTAVFVPLPAVVGYAI